MSEKKALRCTATQANSKCPDFQCKLNAGAHNIHVDPRTGERWAEGPYPRNWNRRWKKNYSNRKLGRKSALAAARAKKDVKKGVSKPRG